MSIRELWEKGKLWEIFGFSNDSFNSIELGNKYSELVSTALGEDLQFIDDSFSILNAPISRNIYRLCRAAMLTIDFEVGKSRYVAKESEIWHSLWSYCSSGWREPTHEAMMMAKVQAGLSKPASTPKEKTQEELLKEVADLIRTLDKQGLNRHQIAEVLVQQGIPFTTATHITDYYFKAKEQAKYSWIRSLAGYAVIGLIIWGVSSLGMCGGPTTTDTNNVSPPPSSGAQPLNTTASSSTDPSESVLIYLDSNYSMIWDSTNVPDLNKLTWTKSSQGSGWETATLVVYLRNTGTSTVSVNATATSSFGFAVIGWSVSSNTVTLKPNDRSPMYITLNLNSIISTGGSIYFHYT